MFFWFGFPFIAFLPVFLVFLALRGFLFMFRPPQRGGLFPGYEGEQELLAQLETRGYSHRQARDRQAQLFKLAYRLGGRLTVSDIVIETGMGLTESQAFIDSMVDNSHVRMEVDANGLVIYEFPEIIDRYRRDAERGR